jgi:hypothetical protein
LQLKHGQSYNTNIRNINGGGSKDFTLAHHLKEGDVCVQEVVNRAAS